MTSEPEDLAAVALSDRILDGTVPADGCISSLLGALRGPASSNELDRSAATIAAMTSTLTSARPSPVGVIRRPRLRGRAVAVLVAAATLSTAGVAAAATGSLPDAVQDRVADLLQPVVGLPGGDGAVDPGAPEGPGGDDSFTDTGDDTTTGVSGCGDADTHGEHVAGVVTDESLSGAPRGDAAKEAARSECGRPAAAPLTGPATNAGPPPHATPAVPASPSHATPAVPATPALPATPAVPATPAEPATAVEPETAPDSSATPPTHEATPPERGERP